MYVSLTLPPPPTVEWCRSEAFSPVVGEFVMTDLRSTEYAIPDLDKVCNVPLGELYLHVVEIFQQP